ncbi:uncharacterized protein BXZ73DRAFT_48932 [Epithele typhae]|uniref:uncharacterized protein n=1 Tax=Epithele typhae TaxID=378194 RepID=UPI0020075987|nr:uncharacterized protein BXZ73DRAFT_48932 [Epithele typhae]KAH9927429.1 hypothetical protein BXZ73DRAFT_48932 [Epithele typhae]
MPLAQAVKTAIEEVISALTTTTSRRSKRRLADMFLELVDRQSWPEYYHVIPKPRCINGIRTALAQNKYRHVLDAFEDLNTVFLNALHYNEEGSQIAKDAETLKGILLTEWKRRPILPPPPTTPSQKPHAKKVQKERAAATPTPANAPPTPSTSQPLPKPSTSSSAMDVDPHTSSSRPQSKQTAAKLRTPDHPSSSDIEVDVGGTPEPEPVAPDAAREGEGDEIVRQLEKSLPRWEGFADVGWAEGLSSDRMMEILSALSGYRDRGGNRPADHLEAMPEETTIPDLSFNAPLSFSLVQSRIQAGYYYQSPQAFDKEMSQLFLKARRWYERRTEVYGQVLVLQRLYHALTSPNPPFPPYESTNYFAGVPAGPGLATPLNSTEGEAGTGVTMFRVSVKDRKVVDEVQFKGWSVRLADWLHLSNPDDASRPIIGQVFKCYVSEDGPRKGQPGVTVCWYYRPEQTWHTADKQFYEREVLKTGHFVDHPVEDIMEKIACQFTARHVRGRPRPPFWYPGWPLYVCDYRYHERERERGFVRIKNWNSCIPEELRKNAEFMPIYNFEQTVFPRRVPSPFVLDSALHSSGGLVDADGRSAPAAVGTATGTGAGAGTTAITDEATSGSTVRKSSRPKRAAAAKSDAERIAALKGVPVPTTTTTAAATAQHVPPAAPPRDDRSILAAGGVQLGSSVVTEELPSETARHFDRDPETGEVLWFAAAPVDIVHAPLPRHSLKYLAHLARKRKEAGGGEGEADVDVPAPKKQRMPPTATEALVALLEEHGML